MGDKLRKFKMDRQQEKQSFKPRRERPRLDLDEEESDIRYPQRMQPPQEKEHESQEA